MVVQLHCFTSSFLPPGQGRWLPSAHASLATIIVLVALGFIPESIVADSRGFYPVYGKSAVFMLIPLLTLLARNVYIFWNTLKMLDNPALYNQIFFLLLVFFILTIFSLATLPP